MRSLVLVLSLLAACAVENKVIAVPADPQQCSDAGGVPEYTDPDGDGWAAVFCCALTVTQLQAGGYDPDDTHLCPESGARTKEDWEADGGGVTDCDEDDADIHPNNDAESACDEVDSDCDDSLDDGATPEWYFDGDADAHGDGNVDTLVVCADADGAPPAGYTAAAGDCDDQDPDVHPGAEEVCNGVDDDCDGETDEDQSGDWATWYADADEDGFGDDVVTLEACAQPEGYVAEGGDCDDQDAAANPDAAETCDGVDDDCDGTVDEDDATDASTWYLDADADGHGATTITTACDQPVGYVSDADDCDDGDDAVYPGATETCGDGVDQDCDGADAESWVTSGDFEGVATGTAGYDLGGCWSGEGDATVVDTRAESGVNSLYSAGGLTALTFCSDTGFQSDFAMSWDLYDDGTGAQSLVLFHSSAGYSPGGDVFGVGYYEDCVTGSYCAYVPESGATVSLAAREAGWVHFEVAGAYTTAGGSDIDWDVCVTTTAGTTCGATTSTSRAAVRSFRLHSDRTPSWWDDMAACAR